jgi:ABC-type glycerol-3-phosphate transport system substrate-binding protein
MMNRILRIASCGLLIFLAGCSSLQSFDFDWIDRILYTPTPVPVKTSTVRPPTPQATIPSTGQPEVATADPNVLRVWLPPQFSPNANHEAGTLLKQRLASFEAAHPGLKIEVRIKGETGEADLLNSLSITSMAATGALPDLVALPRPALEAAAQKGLVHSLDDLSVELQDSDFYPYARELAKVNGTPYGIPFAGDAVVITYRPDFVWIKSWDDILLSEGRLIFAGADPQAEVGLALYMSAGGELLDAQGRPTLDQETLEQVLEIFSKGRAATLFPAAVTNLSNDEQVLQEYRARRADMAIVHFSNYRPTQDGLVQPLMALGEEAHYTFATGWSWALAGQTTEKKQLASELAEFLTSDDFLADWIQASGYLPVSLSSATEGEDSPVPSIVEAAQPIPSADLLLVVGPVMQEALTRVLSGERPETVARSAVEKLK